MGLKLINFKTVGFDDPLVTSLVIDEQGYLSDTATVTETIDCQGSYLSPGWTDLHVHVWHGGSDVSVRPAQAGRGTGVTTMADAGSAGEAAFHGFREYVIDREQETIKAFLNIGSIGLVACNRVPELMDVRFIDVDRTMAVIEANRDVICGIKVRASGVICGNWGITPAKIAKRVAEIAGLPLMVHVGEPPPLIDEVFDILTPGDVVTHCFNGKCCGSIRDTKALFAQALDMQQRGILMDVGHGVASFDFETARLSMQDGLKPFSISTDMHLWNVNGPVYNLATTMSKLLALGLCFEEVIEASTNRPRSFLGLGGRSSLTSGDRADFTIFDLADNDELATDSEGNTITLDKTFEPKFTLIGRSMAAAARRGPGKEA